MTDIGKTIGRLSLLRERLKFQKDILGYGSHIEDLSSAIDLLKEQEAVEPKVSSTEQRCGNCNKVIEMDGWIACPWCGKPIAWNEWWNKNGGREVKRSEVI